MYVDCYSFARIGVWDTKDCCESCHEDTDFGYYMLDLESPFEDLLGEVCCTFDVEVTSEIYNLLRKEEL